MRSFILLFAAAATMNAANFYLTVAGLGGEQDYEQRFTGQASDIAQLLAKEPGAKVETLSGKDATKANIEAKMSAIARQATANDTFVLFLIGHGAADQFDYKFNIPGEDISSAQLASLLDKIAAKQVVVNSTSSSGGAIETLKKPGRIVITGTKAGTEKNATVFARFWVEAFRDPAADADKNQTLTALEAFKYTEAKVDNYFKSLKRLATEHPLLEDTGKGEGAAKPSAENGQGLIAGRTPLLHLGSVASIVNDPAKQALLKRKDELETAIDELKYRKAALPARDYTNQLRQLVTELAKVQAGLDQ